jgi:hypothetical protein
MAIKRTNHVNVRLRPREAQELRALAEARGETVSELVRAVLGVVVRHHPREAMEMAAAALASDVGLKP